MSCISHGYSRMENGGRTYRVVGGPCRLSIATHGSRGSLISRSKKGFSTQKVEDRSRTLVLMANNSVTSSPRLIAPRDANVTSQNSGFLNLNSGEAWNCSRGVLYKGVDSLFAAQWAIAKTRTNGKPFRYIDEVSIVMAPEDGVLPANCLVFSACRNTANGRGAFDGSGARREEMPGAISGERKPAQYWETMLPYRRRYYDDDRYHSYGTGHGKRLAAEAGAAVRRIGLPVYIAIYVNNHLRFFRLFSDFVDYLCYCDLKAWQSIVRGPQHEWPQPIQP